ncbi:hypothetical protein C8F04DRAFT_1255177 [Mycena alexandri]|uniref:Uncharacterized protein n=1 Tax=Mycena alexandri TaxID=1745969 RepID=A0AAD6T495_9AGAR|nr:hypothetical protein C8F04DRAFT_1255177 [Mycena alexandri]
MSDNKRVTRQAASSKSSTGAPPKPQNKPKQRKPAAASLSAAALFSSDSDVSPSRVRSSRDDDNYEPEAPTPKKRDFATMETSPDDELPDPNTLSSLSPKKAPAPRPRPRGKKKSNPPGIPANSSQAQRRRRSPSASVSAPVPKRIKLDTPVEVLVDSGSESSGDDAPLGARGSGSAKPARSSLPAWSVDSEHGGADEGTPIPEGAINLAEYELPDSLGLVNELPAGVRFRPPSVSRWFVAPRVDLAVLERGHAPMEERVRLDNADPALFPTKAWQSSADASWCAGFNEHPQRMVDQYMEDLLALNVLRFQRPYALPLSPLPDDPAHPVYTMPNLKKPDQCPYVPTPVPEIPETAFDNSHTSEEMEEVYRAHAKIRELHDKAEVKRRAEWKAGYQAELEEYEEKQARYRTNVPRFWKDRQQQILEYNAARRNADTNLVKLLNSIGEYAHYFVNSVVPSRSTGRRSIAHPASGPAQGRAASAPTAASKAASSAAPVASSSRSRSSFMDNQVANESSGGAFLEPGEIYVALLDLNRVGVPLR